MQVRLIKGFAIGITGLFVFITIFSLFIPSRISITKAVVINTNAAKVFAQVKNLKNWKNWQPVFKIGSADIKFETGADSISRACQWESNGKLNKIVITADTGNTIAAYLTRNGENTIENKIRILPLADANQVQAEWNVQIKLKWYPWEKFYGIFIEKVSGQGYEDALNGLKEYCESH